jgi:hypothetical protein
MLSFCGGVRRKRYKWIAGLAPEKETEMNLV